MADLKAVVGYNLRRLRKRSGLSQAELADRVERSINVVGRIERGETAPSLETIERFCEALETTPSELFLTDGVELSDLHGRLAGLFSCASRLNDDQLQRAERILRAAFE